MFGLSEEQYNVVKKIAKKCGDEIQTAIDDGNKYDSVAASIINMHYEKVGVLVTRTQFIYLAGYLRGRWGVQGEYE